VELCHYAIYVISVREGAKLIVMMMMMMMMMLMMTVVIKITDKITSNIFQVFC